MNKTFDRCQVCGSINLAVSRTKHQMGDVVRIDHDTREIFFTEGYTEVEEQVLMCRDCGDEIDISRYTLDEIDECGALREPGPDTVVWPKSAEEQ